MLSTTRRWFRRNRTPIAIGVGIVGAGYLATQYVLNKINDARERMSSDRIAKENLRRRFEQNQEDCTYTILALLPSATTNVLEAMNTENITLEIQQMKGATKNVRSGDSSVVAPSIADTTMTEEEGKSVVSLQSESGVHASQATLPSVSSAGDATQDSGQALQKPRKTKRQLWDDLTISSITRAFTLIYTVALLTMLTRIQLNLLGRRSYLSSVISLATGAPQSTINLENNDDDNSEQTYGSDFETNRKYLTFSWWLLNRGWTDVMEKVETAVREVFGHLSPRDLLSFDTFSQLSLEVRKKVETKSDTERPGAQWLPFLLPPTPLEDFVLKESGVLGDSATATANQSGSSSTLSSVSTITPALRRLLDETSDLVESPAFCHVLTLLLDAGFSVLLNKKLLPGAFGSDVPSTSSTAEPSAEAVADPASRAVLLPKILSVLTRQAHAIGNGMPNEYLQEMEYVQELGAFAAVVYSSNWENEIHQDEELAAAAAGLSDAAAAATYGDGAVSQQEHEHSNRVRPSQTTTVDESVVMVDPSQSSFESAWEKALGSSQTASQSQPQP
ncbi:Peroxin-3 family protein [Xylaria bambusicola]|uniref:Peroxin-3 family protein n=1 Tax=Xylaria bambusicola TaxID=326684 RepID=UPI002008EA46|nr:Peroxin-3 family protein [Xylaria bambusicola]KAI0526439.1 Peroxin-3 family protein [Xylaria bambusicola]